MPHPSEIRILTVRQPWALHIIQSGKDVENRKTNIAGSYRGPVAIHAALKADEEALRALPGQPPNGIPRVFHYGAIIGVVDLVDVHELDSATCYDDSEWATDDHYHLILENPRPVEPIPYRGGLGLRKITDPELIKQLLDPISGDAITTTETRTK